MEGSLLGTATLAPISAAANGATSEFEITVEALIADLLELFRENFVEALFSRQVRIPVYDGTD